MVSRSLIANFIAVTSFTVFSIDAPPAFTLDLTLQPEERWKGALELLLSHHPYEYSFAPVFATHNESLFNALTPEHFSKIGRAVKVHWPETAAELSGIVQDFAAVGHSEVSFEYLAAWLYFHELAHSDAATPAVSPRECTGLLVQMPDGSVLHGANMDQSPAAARNLTLRVRAIGAAGALVFEGVDWYTLLSTGMSRMVRQGLASVQENWRTTETRTLASVIADIESGVISQMLVFRRFFTDAYAATVAGRSPPTFTDFVENVTATRLAAPFYVVAGGPGHGQGIVIARGLVTADGVAKLNVDAGNKTDFFLCQCNTDRWLPDDPKDPRRTAAERLVNRLSNRGALTQLDLFATMSAYPVHNPHTAYTAIMSADTGELHAYVREAICPVDPAASVVLDGRYCTAHDMQHVLYS